MDSKQKLEKIDIKLLPNYLISNKKKFEAYLD